MGNKLCHCVKNPDYSSDPGSSMYQSNLSLRASDRTVINNAKKKCRKLSQESNSDIGEFDTLKNITEEPIEDYYDIEGIIGSGKYGVVRQAFSKHNPDFKVAIKCIEFEKLSNNYHSCVSEILTLKKMDHPNIVKLYELFKDDKNLYVVMEYCEGKELFEYVVEHTKINERDSATIIKQLLKTVKYLNSLNICHRDIKPENILVDPKNLSVKLIDFGLSTYYNEFTDLNTKVGTPYYVAPEVLKGSYGKQCDVWSIGVITYILLTGCPPFQGENLAEVYNEIMYEKLKLYRSDWVDLSANALEFVKAVLKKNPEVRLQPHEALKHPFIRNRDSKSKIKPSVLKKLATSNSAEKEPLRKEIFTILCTYIKSEVIEKWNKIFNSLDSEGNGKIQISEVLKKLREAKVAVPRLSIIEESMKEDPDATISYSDFLSKVINLKKEISEEDIHKVFDQFDTDKSGRIERDDLKSLIQRRCHEGMEAETFFKEVDSTQITVNDPEISYVSSNKKGKRNDIGPETFKAFVFGDGDVSEVSESTPYSSFNNQGRQTEGGISPFHS